MQKLELKQKKKDFKSKGVFEIGERNERWDLLIEFAEEHKLIVGNMLYQKQITDIGHGSRQTEKNPQETR